MALRAPTVSIISAGAMGAGLAKRLVDHGCRVLTCLDGRSSSSRDRANSAGMIHASLDEIASESDWLLSVLPPSEAEGFARSFLAAWTRCGGKNNDLCKNRDSGLVFVDCNAKSPNSALSLERIFYETGVGFVDASILGLPPYDDHDPSIYASANPSKESQEVLRRFEGLSDYGLKVKALYSNTEEEVGVGAASAVKMTYSGIMKGMVGLYMTNILCA